MRTLLIDNPDQLRRTENQDFFDTYSPCSGDESQ